MPERWVEVEWPDGSTEVCYSPSTVVEDHLAAGKRYSVTDFSERANVAWRAASERVKAIYGFRCSRADAQLLAIERALSRFDASAVVTVITIAKAPR